MLPAPPTIRPARLRALLLLPFLALPVACRHSPGSVPTTPDPGEEEVNVGYGTQPRSTITGSISSVTPDDLDLATGARMEDYLANRVPGLQVVRVPGGSASLRIRGQKSFSASEEPLVIIDGMPARMDQLFALSPRDVERVDVLKDAGSAAMYGSRGANGVVLVTTKRAQ